ncbi:adenine deaminase C-terminal domain-containing protein [Paenibacillus monticola]|uniref:Adenine deaminase n=1 Tax=Paenibacillus monticola TaxID=2666075 RepID=A0A7X2H456_9BACL|nr:adenine deaminase C-terminal domain-containing protein [Paenibacillus monticola]MRN53249.1 amidohydrolase family protein [Paenibacillus monticola]
MRTDQLILNVNVYNSYYKKFNLGNVAVKDGRFLYIGTLGTETFEADEIIEGEGRTMVPGLIDIHLHIESTMITPETFSYGILRHGVTTIVPEPHEMANVFGVEGVHEMIRASEDCEVDMFYAIPSSVPATTLETTGGSIEIADIDQLMQTEKMICLGEVMNYVDVIRDPGGKSNQILQHIRTHYPDLVIEGHTPKLLELDLHRLIYAGIDSDHTHQSLEGLAARIAAGMFIEIQEKSMTPDVVDYLIQHSVSEHFCFVTDDVMTDSLVATGHLDHLVRKAIVMGMSPADAVYAATFTPSRRMKMNDRGMIAPNKIADFLLLSDLTDFEIDAVYKRGLQVYDRHNPLPQREPLPRFPAHFYNSVKLGLMTAIDFEVSAEQPDGRYGCRVMMVNNVSTFTEELHGAVEVRGGQLQWQESEYGLIATFERYGKNGNRAYGLIGGATIKRGAIATTYSHDNHNLLVVGHNPEDMAVAANAVISSQGGFCVVCEGEIIASLNLPVGGILTEEPLERTAVQVSALRSAMESLGYDHYNPIMSISTHSLPVSPALKITDLGLIDVGAGKVVPLLFPLSEA